MIRLAGMSIPLPPYSAIRPSRARVLLAATTVVPARSVIVVRASVVPVNGKVSNPCALQGVIEPSHTAQREDLLIPREVVTVEVVTVEPFMEWVTRMDMDMEWISGGYGYFFVKSFGVEWVMG